jgi:hypothetical protein
MNVNETAKLTENEALRLAKLMLIEETKKNFRLKDVFAEEFGKDFNEQEIEAELKLVDKSMNQKEVEVA